MSDQDSPKIGEALARIEVQIAGARESVDEKFRAVQEKFSAVQHQLKANESQNEQANTFAQEGIARIDRRFDTLTSALDSERPRTEAAMTSVRRDLNKRIDSVELQTATRAAIIEDRVDDLELAGSQRAWRAAMAKPLLTIAYGAVAAAVGVGIDQLLK